MKIQKVYFSTFRLFDFSIFRFFDFSIFRLFDSSTFRFFDFSTFRFFDFSSSLSTPNGLSYNSKREKSKSTFRLFDFSSSLSTLNGLSCNSKSEKTKSIRFDFSTFRLFFFPLDSQRFKLKIKKWKVKSTFRLFDFSSYLWTLNGLR